MKATLIHKAITQGLLRTSAAIHEGTTGYRKTIQIILLTGIATIIVEIDQRAAIEAGPVNPLASCARKLEIHTA